IPDQIPRTLPEVVESAPGRAVAGLVTHLHRDHADAGALVAALAPQAPVYEPPKTTGDGVEIAGLLQAEAELTACGLRREPLAPWDRREVGPFRVTALPAVDGLGDPQVSWLVEADGVRIVHLGDTMPHGGWWPIALRHGPIDVAFVPANGAVVRFPHRRPASPLPVAMDPPQAAAAARALGAAAAVPIHAEGYAVDGFYTPVPEAVGMFAAEAAALGVTTCVPVLGVPVEVTATVQA
ncbi:MAG: MBL fold metallo-hydrolase, partial [Solirubrobacteraceae bacterium]|nr:MBL fold metallo-hydrolase [Patulibacter sp.]